MSDENLQRTIGRLETSITGLTEQQALGRKEQREDMGKIYDRLNEISISGCAVGTKNCKAIEELQKRPERLVGIGAACAAILAFIGSLLIWINKSI